MAAETPITQKTLYEEIKQLYLKCYQDSSVHIIAFDNACNYIMQLLATCDVTVIRRKDKVVGCIVYQKFHNTLLGNDELYIHEWFIHPRWRKKLVGAQLYSAIEQVGRDLGCKRLRGFSSNEEMIETIKARNDAKPIAMMFEREL
jgi:GNAT superfamily N-acetyltransferase